MSNWQRWSKQRDVSEGLGEGGDPVSDFKFDTFGDETADDYDHVQQELWKAVMSKYPDEAMQFLDGIAQRGDEEIAALLRKLQQDKPTQMKEPEHPTDGDEVVPPGADTGYSDEGGVGGE